MTLFDYTTNIPFANNPPSVDQPNMEINTNSIDGIIAVDHVGFNSNNGGYHTDIHMIPQGSDPAQITDIGQIYTKTVTFNGKTDAALFYRSGTTLSSSNSLTQITAPKGTSASANGYAFLPGGIIMQWGQFLSSFGSGTTTGSVNFNISFPNGSFSITTAPLGSNSNLPSQEATAGIRQSSLGSASSFDYIFVTGSNKYTGFTWIAIGN